MKITLLLLFTTPASGTPPRKWDAALQVDQHTATYFTRRGNDLYLIPTQWQDVLSVDGVSPGTKVSLAGYKGSVKAAAKGGKLVIMAPAVTPATVPCPYARVYSLEKATS
ncbi:MAG: hypothetical protein ICV83_01500 [Cytophagales bacterium]|nr:hypothetical protein [Cytophagales bacterium]